MNAGLNILIVDDEPSLRKTLTICLEADGHAVVAGGEPDRVLETLQERVFDIAFLDIRLGTASGMDLIGPMLATCPWLKIVVMTAYASIDSAVQAMRSGAADYLQKPFTPAQVQLLVSRLGKLRELERKLDSLQLGDDPASVDFSSHSPAMQRAIATAQQVAASDASVLIRGESGTGKSLLAKVIHQRSARGGKPFSVISCPSLPAELLESELFGHVKGAFTGATRQNPGRIAVTEGGTLFLDEIGDLPLSLQPKLLRFLQERSFERLGDVKTQHANVRVISATNVDLEQAVREKRFREDLLFRLNVIEIRVPPLRERVDDIVPLAERLLAKVSRARPVAGFSEEARQALRAHAWPGNVRELSNAIERAVIIGTGRQIEAADLPFAPALPEALRLGDRVSLEKIETAHLRKVLARTDSLEEAADILGIDAATLYRKRKKLGL